MTSLMFKLYASIVIELVLSGRMTAPTEYVVDSSGSSGFAPNAAACGSAERNTRVRPGANTPVPLLLQLLV